MTLALVAVAVLAVVIFAFVLEPVLRARGDRVVIDSAVLPDHDAPTDDADDESAASNPQAASGGNERLSGHRVSIDRPAGSDAS